MQKISIRGSETEISGQQKLFKVSCSPTLFQFLKSNARWQHAVQILFTVYQHDHSLLAPRLSLIDEKIPKLRNEATKKSESKRLKHQSIGHKRHSYAFENQFLIFQQKNRKDISLTIVETQRRRKQLSYDEGIIPETVSS